MSLMFRHSRTAFVCASLVLSGLLGCPANSPARPPASDADKALVAAAIRKDLDGLKKALSDGANVNVVSPILSKGPPLVMLAREDKSFAEALLAKGADPNLAREDGDTALLLAAVRGNTGTMKVLLDKGANVNTKNKIGYTAVNEAVHKGQLAAVELLVARGADLKLGGLKDTHLPFDRALGKATRRTDISKDRLKLVKLILDKSPPEQARLDKAVKAASVWQVAGPNICALAKALIEKGATKDKKVTPFLSACDSGSKPPGPPKTRPGPASQPAGGTGGGGPGGGAGPAGAGAASQPG